MSITSYESAPAPFVYPALSFLDHCVRDPQSFDSLVSSLDYSNPRTSGFCESLVRINMLANKCEPVQNGEVNLADCLFTFSAILRQSHQFSIKGILEGFSPASLPYFESVSERVSLIRENGSYGDYKGIVFSVGGEDPEELIGGLYRISDDLLQFVSSVATRGKWSDISTSGE